MENFNKIKQEFISRSKTAGLYSGEYKRALESGSIQEILKVITDNFFFSCRNKIIDVDFLEKIGKETCESNDLYFNVDTNKGFLLVSDNSTVHASGSATVEVYDSATVCASGNSTVYAHDNAKVNALGSAMVEAYGSAYINSFNEVEHKVSESAILRYYHDNRVVLADVDSLSK